MKKSSFLHVFLSKELRKQGNLMWKVGILMVICFTSETNSLLSNPTNLSMTKDKASTLKQITNCKDFKETLLDISRHSLSTSLHKNVVIKHSKSKGHYTTMKEDIDAFNVIGIEKPITFMVFDPGEYQWRRLPTSSKRYTFVF